MTQIRPTVRAFALAGLLAFAFAPAACGGSDDDGSGGAQAAAPAKTASPAAPRAAETPEEQELLDVYDTMLTALEAHDAGTYCAGLTDKARTGLPEYLGFDDCEKMVARYRVGSDSKEPRAKVVDVEVDGERGVVSTRSANAINTAHARFERRDGRWLAVFTSASL